MHHACTVNDSQIQVLLQLSFKFETDRYVDKISLQFTIQENTSNCTISVNNLPVLVF